MGRRSVRYAGGRFRACGRWPCNFLRSGKFTVCFSVIPAGSGVLRDYHCSKAISLDVILRTEHHFDVMSGALALLHWLGLGYC